MQPIQPFVTRSLPLLSSLLAVCRDRYLILLSRAIEETTIFINAAAWTNMESGKTEQGDVRGTLCRLRISLCNTEMASTGIVCRFQIYFFLCMFSCLQATILFLVRKSDPQTLELASIVIAPTGYGEASVLVLFMFCRSGQHIILFFFWCLVLFKRVVYVLLTSFIFCCDVFFFYLCSFVLPAIKTHMIINN